MASWRVHDGNRQSRDMDRNPAGEPGQRCGNQRTEAVAAATPSPAERATGGMILWQRQG